MVPKYWFTETLMGIFKGSSTNLVHANRIHFLSVFQFLAFFHLSNVAGKSSARAFFQQKFARARLRTKPPSLPLAAAAAAAPLSGRVRSRTCVLSATVSRQLIIYSETDKFKFFRKKTKKGTRVLLVPDRFVSNES